MQEVAQGMQEVVDSILTLAMPVVVCLELACFTRGRMFLWFAQFFPPH